MKPITEFRVVRALKGSDDHDGDVVETYAKESDAEAYVNEASAIHPEFVYIVRRVQGDDLFGLPED